MKQASKFFALLCALLLAGAVTSCEEPEVETPSTEEPPVTEQPGENEEPTEGEQPKELSVNTYAINGTVYDFGSVAAMMQDENLLIIGTPDKNLRSAEDIFAESDHYFFGAVSPLLVGAKIDVTSEKKLFTLLSTLAGAEIETLSPEFPEEATEGEMTLAYVDGKVSLVGRLVLATGAKFEFNMEAQQRVELIDDIMCRGVETKPVRTAYYLVEEDITTLWLTPAALEHAGELEKVTWYLSLSLSNDLMGKEVDITTLTAENHFEFKAVDNYVETVQSFSNEDLKGATGSFLVEKLGSENYQVVFNIEFGGEAYGAEFEGECMLYELPEVKTNFLTYGKKNNQQEIALVSATLDCSTDVWVVELLAIDQSVFTATVPSNYFTGSMVGFSWSPNLTVSYKGRTYSKANGDGGTIIASYANNRLDFEFIGYDDLSCIYSGECEVK